MNINDNSVLIKEFSERLPYDLYFSHCGKVHKLKLVELDGKNTLNNKYPIEICYPYLRPMSSMTEEEREELSDYLCEQVMSNKIGITIPPNPTQGKGIPFIWMGECMEWLNKNMFDYRGLIEKGLALEAPEDMYNKNN